MRVEFDDTRLPVKMWLDEIEDGARAQAKNLANLPFAFRHVALMPDCHVGYGMPIGGVLATQDVIIPNAVGVDIGCGMGFVQTNVPVSLLKETQTGNGSLLQAMIANIMRNVPTGFAHHKEKQECLTLDKFEEYFSNGELNKELLPEIQRGYYQVGTLGGGNHFIEIQEDENGMAAIMLHSGSRNFGKKICDHFNREAQELNARWFAQVPKAWDLAFLPLESKEGQAYTAWMQLALGFALENRQKMLNVTKGIFHAMVEKYTGFNDIEESLEVNAHHNYAAFEHHFGKNVWVHRKGAIRARGGELGIIPGAMGSYSHIVEGLGNADSFNSCSHGAGRKMGRKEASHQFSVDKTILDLREQGIVLGKSKKDDVSEECRWAYKDIDEVIANELDLVKPLKKLKTVGVIKG